MNDPDYVPPSDIMGVPQVSQTPAGPRRGIKRGKTVVLTSNPYLKELQSDVAKRKKPAAKVQLFNAKPGGGKGKGKQPRKGKVGKASVEDIPCLYCSGLYSESRSREQWIMCDTTSGRMKNVLDQLGEMQITHVNSVHLTRKIPIEITKFKALNHRHKFV